MVFAVPNASEEDLIENSANYLEMVRHTPDFCTPFHRKRRRGYKAYHHLHFVKQIPKTREKRVKENRSSLTKEERSWPKLGSL